MTQEEINEHKSFVAYYFAKFNEKAKSALGYETFTRAFKDISVKLGGPDNQYLKQRRDEFDVFYEWREGYNKRPVSEAVSNYHHQWKNISFEEFTTKVKRLLLQTR
ncbi:hypothetical protein FSU_1377 [Fibrobacter succinogenes subsp. succinogenes S85]|uniref:Uncharacterized protein n=1 Tax=Fibrobacter succinogenes (strain ATCC 19169 / S85) TaxID=59374 RepID=C9RP71_FIBSS|nr:hypothetical protein [Fibrobacter succinogenes]ACX74535.1 hypothetical protein Fisuc_0928 [Fibrobacter succinogenes subsp. succinogenes S85]ADL24546.1 hypothetical protein FSU_1377 [Fibrobacter succinogenes subsp. succinogenes S85]